MHTNDFINVVVDMYVSREHYMMNNISAPTVAELYNTIHDIANGINIYFIIIIIIQLLLCTILKDIYV